MVTHVFHCPHCQQAEPVVRFGTNRSGTRRLWCKVCRKAFGFRLQAGGERRSSTA